VELAEARVFEANFAWSSVFMLDQHVAILREAIRVDNIEFYYIVLNSTPDLLVSLLNFQKVVS
jgi:hypothetical protein